MSDEMNSKHPGTPGDSSTPGTHGILKPEEYADPQCPLCGEGFGVTAEVRPVPQQRIIQKMDEYMSRRDYAGAERHLLYWLAEAELGRDLRGQLMLRNELTGHYRKTRARDKSLENADKAVELLKELEMEGTVSAGTTYINAATAYNAFGESEHSLELFHKAREVYEAAAAPRADGTDGSTEDRTDGRSRPGPGNDGSGVATDLLGGLYNNMALTETAVGLYDEAWEHYEKALALMSSIDGGEPQCAITYLNMAQTAAAQYGMEDEAAEQRISGHLEQAWELLQKCHEEYAGANDIRKGYLAFVFESCAPGFQYYGWFAAAKKLRSWASPGQERNTF